MARFELNIEDWYDQLRWEEQFLRGIAVIQYPLFMIYARTVERVRSEYDALDRTLVHFFQQLPKSSLSDAAVMLGVQYGQLNERASFLLLNEILQPSGEHLELGIHGERFLNSNDFELEEERTRMFLLDGIDFRPLPSVFYREGKGWFISREKSMEFSPDIIHEASIDHARIKILALAPDERERHRVPIGLKDILEVDAVEIAFPIGVSLSSDVNGLVTKQLINGFDFSSNPNSRDAMNFFLPHLERRVKGLRIQIGSPYLNIFKNEQVDLVNNWKYLDWLQTTEENANVIFSLDQGNYYKLLVAKFGIDFVNPKLVELGNSKIIVKIDRKHFGQEGTLKHTVLEALARGRDYLHQWLSTGVFIAYMDVIAGDEYVQSLVDLYEFLFQYEEIGIEDLSMKYDGKMDELRSALFTVERNDIVLDLDIFRCMGKPMQDRWTSLIEINKEN